VRARAIPLRNVWELTGALVEEWGNISQQELANLVQSIRRCTAVLNAAGGHTRYELTFDFVPPFVELVQFVSQLLNLVTVCSYKYLHMLSLLKIN
jgi:hypothetical protein